LFFVYIFQTVTKYLALDRCIHMDFGNIVCNGRYRWVSLSSTTMLLFFFLFGVGLNRYLTYRTNIYVDHRSCCLYFQMPLSTVCYRYAYSRTSRLALLILFLAFTDQTATQRRQPRQPSPATPAQPSPAQSQPGAEEGGR
jgi:hypothetical protein